MSWWKFVTEAAGTDNQSEIGRRMGITQPSVSQWKTSAPKKETVRRFAETFGVSVIDAFIAAGYFTEEEARRQSLKFASTDELLAEIERRNASR